ncbi:hypothetical protein F5Y14DRAFT_456058 [Nemania sp. NC0429]|nr:hypothetical protein F5Y14DRAFT_456058 [Nemania sp. NC0429]
MDRLQLLTGTTSIVRPRVTLPRRSGVGKRASVAKKPIIIGKPVPPGKPAVTENTRRPLVTEKPAGRNLIRCLTQSSYTCQLSIHILLYARSHDLTLRPIGQNDSLRCIELKDTGSSYNEPFDYLVSTLDKIPNPQARLRTLDEFEESLVNAIQLLHANDISFPVTSRVVEIEVPLRSNYSSKRSPFKLFLKHNTCASWASKNKRLSPTWKAEEIAKARQIFDCPRLITRIVASRNQVLLDPETQKALAAFLSKRPNLARQCAGLSASRLTPELAHEIACGTTLRGDYRRGREVVESFFGRSVQPPKPGTSPDVVYSSFVMLRARAIDVEKSRTTGSDYVALYQELEPELRVVDPALLTRLLLCRAEVAHHLREPSRRRWWLAAMDLYDAFLSSQPARSRLETFARIDAYGYRKQQARLEQSKQQVKQSTQQVEHSTQQVTQVTQVTQPRLPSMLQQWQQQLREFEEAVAWEMDMAEFIAFEEPMTFEESMAVKEPIQIEQSKQEVEQSPERIEQFMEQLENAGQRLEKSTPVEQCTQQVEQPAEAKQYTQIEQYTQAEKSTQVEQSTHVEQCTTSAEAKSAGIHVLGE